MFITATFAASSLIASRAAVAQTFNAFNQLSFSGQATDLPIETTETFNPLSTTGKPFSLGTNSGTAVVGNTGITTLTATADVGSSSVEVTLDVTPLSENDLQSTNIVLNESLGDVLKTSEPLTIIKSSKYDVIRVAPTDDNSINISQKLTDLNLEKSISPKIPSISSISVLNLEKSISPTIPSISSISVFN